MFYEKPISSDQFIYKDIIITYLRTGVVMGWYFDFEDKRYGDFVTMSIGDDLKEALRVLDDQAKRTLDELIK